jgi:hypothetical protein
MPVTAPGRIIPEPMTPAAQARPRDSSGRVTAPIRIEVRFARDRGGYRHYCDSFAEAAGFLASPSFKQSAAAVKTVTIVAQAADLGPDIETAASYHDHRQSA